METSKKRREPSGDKSAVSPKNSVYGSKDPNLRPECIYLYYLKATADLKERARAFLIDRRAPIPPVSMQGQIEGIVRDIRQGLIRPCGWNLGDIKWRRPSYIVIIFDDPKVKLSSDDAITILDSSGGSNHPFGDGKDIVPFDTITGFYCFNHMTYNGTSAPIPDNKAEYFKLTVNHSEFLSHSKIKLREHTDTGTNMGPPIGPPP